MENKEKQTVHEEALAKLLEYSYREDTPLMMKNDNGFFGLYFDMRTKGLSDFKYTRLWYAINQVIRADNKNWMYRYWEFADQYYGSIFAYEVNDKEAVKFFEFHVAVGGLLALNGKYEWVDHIAWFTNCLPPKYFLVPSTFSEIFNWLVYFAKMSESSVDLDVKYHLYSQYDGVRAGANLYKGIVKYLALMMCRLPKIDFNVRYVESMALPHVYGSSDNEKNFISVNEKNIRTVKFLKQVVSELDNQPNTAKEKAMKLLEEYIVACENMISYRMSNTDNEKLNHIKSTLLSEFDRQIKILIMRKDSELKSFVKQSWFAESIDALDGFDFLEGSNYNNINRESVMIRQIIVGAIVRYIEVLKSCKAKYTYVIRFRDISNALTRLCVPNGYIVLIGSIGTHLLPVGYVNNPNVHFIYSRESEIIIMRKSQLPFICFEENDNVDWRLIDDKMNKVLYSNIWKLQNNSEIKRKSEEHKHFDLRIGCYVSICMPPKDELTCIRIKAIDSITQNTFDLAKVRKVEE